MNINCENSSPLDYVKITEEKNRFVDILLEKQKEYSTGSIEYQSIKLAVAAITFSMELHVECAKKVLTERQRKKIAEIESLMQREYKDYFPCEKATEDDISLKDVSKILTCLKELLKKHEKSTEIFAALQCSLKDIETATSQEKRFLIFLKNL
jgi:hypothetical protein